MRKLFIALLSALLCLLLSVSALAADGLSAFQETQTYQPGMFSDVKAGSWYEAGVRAVYTRGIMNGTGGKAFAPSQTITWAQAAAIAARIHAACGGAEIAAAEGQWYEPYLAYAAQAKLLPSTCPEGAAAASTTITRQELAGLFANVLRADDLPPLNDQSIPDLAAVDAEFRAAVQRMYAAGVFTGKDGGRFDPKGSATRAEIAVIVSRLLLPGQLGTADQHPARVGRLGCQHVLSLRRKRFRQHGIHYGDHIADVIPAVQRVVPQHIKKLVHIKDAAGLHHHPVEPAHGHGNELGAHPALVGVAVAPAADGLKVAAGAQKVLHQHRVHIHGPKVVFQNADVVALFHQIPDIPAQEGGFSCPQKAGDKVYLYHDKKHLPCCFCSRPDISRSPSYGCFQ